MHGAGPWRLPLSPTVRPRVERGPGTGSRGAPVPVDRQPGGLPVPVGCCRSVATIGQRETGTRAGFGLITRRPYIFTWGLAAACIKGLSLRKRPVFYAGHCSIKRPLHTSFFQYAVSTSFYIR